MKKLMAILMAALVALVPFVVRAQSGLNPDNTAQTYTLHTHIVEPWCGLGYPTDFMQHLITSDESWSYGQGHMAAVLPAKKTYFDEYYYYDNATTRNLMSYLWYKDVWTYPNYVQNPAYATRVHTQYDGTNWTDNNSNPVQYSRRMAYRSGNYPSQGCGYAGTFVTTIQGRSYLILNGGLDTLVYTVVLHDTFGVDQVTGSTYSPSHYHIATTAGYGGSQGVSSGAFNDATGNVSINIRGETWYDITPTLINPPGQYDYTYDTFYVSGVPK